MRVRAAWWPGRRTPAPRLTSVGAERLLAWAVAASGEVVAGTREALYVREPAPVEPVPPAAAGDAVASSVAGETRLPWERLEGAEWDADTTTLTVTEIEAGLEGVDGAVRSREITLDGVLPADADRLLQLVRERITATIVLQRHVRVEGRAGVHVVARRAPGAHEVAWGFRVDAGVDPDDPAVRRVAAAALERARYDLGQV